MYNNNKIEMALFLYEVVMGLGLGSAQGPEPDI